MSYDFKNYTPQQIADIYNNNALAIMAKYPNITLNQLIANKSEAVTDEMKAYNEHLKTKNQGVRDIVYKMGNIINKPVETKVKKLGLSYISTQERLPEQPNDAYDNDFMNIIGSINPTKDGDKPRIPSKENDKKKESKKKKNKEEENKINESMTIDEMNNFVDQFKLPEEQQTLKIAPSQDTSEAKYIPTKKTFNLFVSKNFTQETQKQNDNTQTEPSQLANKRVATRRGLFKYIKKNKVGISANNNKIGFQP